MSIKQEILEACRIQLLAKIEILQSEFRIYKESAANEGKSTAGDKHDTSRSMMQLEQEKMGVQLNDLLIQKKTLDQIEKMDEARNVGLGSILHTDKFHFFISVFAKPIQIKGILYHPISIQSPIAKRLLSINLGDEIEFNNITYRLIGIDN